MIDIAEPVSLFGKFFNQHLTSSTTAATVIYLVIITILIFKYKKHQGCKKTASDEKCSIHGDTLKRIISPPRMPFIGNMHLMRDYQDNPWDGFNAIRQQYGDIVSLQMGVHPMILISSIPYIREVLLDKGQIFANRPKFSRYDIIFGGDKEHSLALCDWSDVHRSRRKFCKRGVVPSKHSDRAQFLEKVVADHLRGLIGRIEKKFDPHRTEAQLDKTDILFLTGDIFMKFLCNQAYPHEDEAYLKFNWNCDYIFYDINKCLLIDFLPYLTKFGIGRGYLKELKTITDYCRDFIDERIFELRYIEHKRKHEEERQNQFANENEHHDYLDSIILDQLSSSSPMSLNDYKVGFADLLAGHSAVANILMKLLGHLALDKEAQDMLHRESKTVRLSELDHKPTLPVAEAALLEALRVASSPIVPHVAREDTSIGDYFVPKGSNVLFNNYHINMSEDLWMEPGKYNLKRFLDESKDATTGEITYKVNCPKHFNPFSIGLRQCLGFRMVESISIAAVAMICEKYSIESSDESLTRKLLQPRGCVALSPIYPCFTLRLTPRSS